MHGILKPEGTLIYSTCTLNKEENEENIQWFLSKYKMRIEKVFISVKIITFI